MTPLRILLTAPLVLVATLLAAWAWPAAPTPVTAPPDAPVTRPAIAVLHDWDDRRAEAWESGDVAALAALYAPRSRAGRADTTLLRSYVRRGVHVERLEMQLLAVEVVSATGERVELVVTDRLARVEATHDGSPVDLPDDRPSTTRVVLTRHHGEPWRVGEAYPAR